MPAAPVAGKSTPVRSVPAKQPTKVGSDVHPSWNAGAQAWPAGGDGVIAVDDTSSGAARAAVSSAGAGKSQVGGLGLAVRGRGGDATNELAAVKGKASTAGSPTSIKLSVADRDVTDKAGVRGVLFTMSRADGIERTGQVALDLDYSSFAHAYGADYGGRLRLVRLPSCVLTTPDRPECQIQQPVSGASNVGSAQVVSADAIDVGSAGSTTTFSSSTAKTAATSVQTPAVAGPTEEQIRDGDGGAADAKSTQGSAKLVAATTSGQPVYALTAGPSSAAGNWAATSLSPTYTWGAGNQGAEFAYSVPVTVPPVSAGPSPALTLRYSSNLVDGETSSTNNQASWVGEGWDLQTGYVERSYDSCYREGTGTGDLCWFSDKTITLVFGGKSTRLVKDDNTANLWRPEDDDGSHVELVTDVTVANGDYQHQYWKITQPDGTQFFFGKHKRYAGDPDATNSVQKVLVYGTTSGEPCYVANQPYNSGCDLAYRWNLDYVIDPAGNSMTYFYERYQGKYGNWNGSNNWVYDLTARLKRIDYGTRAGSEGTSVPTARVNLVENPRCDPTSANCTAYPDVPWDQYCPVTQTTPCYQYTPTFWTPWQLAQIYTEVWDAAASAYHQVDSFYLSKTFPAMGDGTPAALWFNGLQRTGKAGGAANSADITLPTMSFGGDAKPNRVNNGTSNHYRLTKLLTGTGEEVDVTYLNSDCTPQMLSSIPLDNNSHRCFPGDGSWFNKYVVSKVVDKDLTGGSPDQTYTFDYSTAGSNTDALWRFDNNDTAYQPTRNWNDFAGYATVTTTHGDALPIFNHGTNTGQTDTSQQTVTKRLYLRGMAGDLLQNGTARYAQITDSNGQTVYDWGPVRGFIREEQTLDNGTAATKTIHSPRFVGPNGYDNPTATRTGNWTYGKAYAYHVVENDTKHQTLMPDGTWRTSETSRGYDIYGNTTTETDYGDISTTADDTCDTISYTTPNTTTWMVAYESQRLTTNCAGTTIDGSQTQYDDRPVGSSPIRGLPSRSNELDTASGTTLTWTQLGHIDYDDLGRVVDSTDKLGAITRISYTPVGAGPLTSTTVTNPAGHITKTTYDPSRAQTTMDIDPNGKVTNAQYDSLGRLTNVYAPHSPAGAVVYTTSTATQPFKDLSGTGTQINISGDEAHKQIQLPFPFAFYGQRYSAATLSTNGLLSFADTASDSSPTTLPNAAAPNAAVYPFWQDLTLDATSRVWTATTGTAPNRQFTIEWSQASLNLQNTRVTFEVTLNEANGAITFNYDGIDARDDDRGNGATVGIENPTGTAATQYAYHQTLLANGKAITFQPTASQPTQTPDIHYEYTVSSTAPNTVSTKTLTASNTQLETIDILDGLLRQRQFQEPSSGSAGGRIITDQQYDARGLAAKAATFWNSAAPSGALAGYVDNDIDAFEVTTFDRRARPTSVALWSHAVTKFTTTAAYGPDRTTIVASNTGATVTVFDIDGQPVTISKYPTATVTGTAETTTYTYDRLGRLTGIKDAANNQSQYTYDLHGRRKTTTEPDTGTTTNTYDAADRLTSTLDSRGQKISYQYDSLGRETTRWSGDVSTGTKIASYLYDTKAKGELTSATRWVGADQYTTSIDGYNDQYEPTGTTWTIPMIQGPLAGTYQNTYGYDLVGQQTSVSYPVGGGLPAETVTHTYDTLGAAKTTTGLSPYITSTTYNNDNQPIQQVYGASGSGQLTRNYTYEAATHRLTNITSKLPDPAHSGQFLTPQNDTYGYDDAGDVLSITDGTDNQAQCFRYDSQHRLTEAWTAVDACSANPTTAAIAGSGKYPYWDSFTFDSTSRRTQDIHRTSASATTTRTYTYPTSGTRPHGAIAVQYTGTASRADSMTYDVAGNTATRTINGVSTDFTYDSEGQFSQAAVHATGGNQVTNHLYDADGTLLIRKDPTGTTLYAAGQEYKAAGSTVTATRVYTHDDQPIGVRTSAGTAWLAADHQGSADLAVNTTTGAVQRRWYTPYGADRSTQGTWPNDHGFLDKQSNTSTGLTDLGAREYDPNLGTFLSPDPVLNPGDPTNLNPYSYASHNPITISDSTGLYNDGHERAASGPCLIYCAIQIATTAAIRAATPGVQNAWRTYNDVSWAFQKKVIGAVAKFMSRSHIHGPAKPIGGGAASKPNIDLRWNAVIGAAAAAAAGAMSASADSSGASSGAQAGSAGGGAGASDPNKPPKKRGTTKNLKSGNSQEAQQGRAAQQSQEWKDLAARNGWDKYEGNGWKINNEDIADARGADGRPIELKPNTKTGIRAGTRALRRYMKATGSQQGELWVWDLTEDGFQFTLKAVPRTARFWTYF
nr:hypothetical protein GCM10020063_009610 [Dactylosporangium thailandense]